MRRTRLALTVVEPACAGGRPLRVIGKAVVALGLAAAVAAAACAPRPAWYEETCERKGFAPGSEAYEACVQRERLWLERLRSDGPR